MWVPVALGVYVTKHSAGAPLPPLGMSEQVVAPKVPLPLLLQLTLPVGMFFEPVLVSATVAVQVTLVPTESGLGEQSTVVELLRWTDRLVVPLLVRCAVSPP